jgi:hypothetical protein
MEDGMLLRSGHSLKNENTLTEGINLRRSLMSGNEYEAISSSSRRSGKYYEMLTSSSRLLPLATLSVLRLEVVKPSIYPLYSFADISDLRFLVFISELI